MLKGFKEFLSRGNIVDLSVAVVIGTAFTALVTTFTDSVVQPLVDRIGAGGDSSTAFSRSARRRPDQFDLNVLLSAAINFVIVAAVVYFVVCCRTTSCARSGEVEQAQDTELSLLTEIRNLLADEGTGKHVTPAPGTGPAPTPRPTPARTAATRTPRRPEQPLCRLLRQTASGHHNKRHEREAQTKQPPAEAGGCFAN